MGTSVLQFIIKGILGRLVAYGALAAGFLLLYRAFQAGNLGAGVPLGAGGAAAILTGMYLMAVIKRREEPVAPPELDPLDPKIEEEQTGDPIHGRDQGA